MTKEHERIDESLAGGQIGELIPEGGGGQCVAGPPDLARISPFVVCAGCQHPTIGRLIAEVLKELEIDGRSIGLLGAGCAGFFLFCLDIDVTMVAHGRAPDVATAIKHAHPECIVFSMQGDGDCIAIGAESFVARLNRGEKLTTIMCNNTVYGTTGGQMAPTTLMGQATSTTPGGRSAEFGGFPVHAAEMAAGFKGVAYSARGALYNPTQYQRTKKYVKAAFQKQMDGVGYGFVEILTPCPPTWRMKPVDALKHIETKVVAEFPLGEFKNVDAIG